MKPIGQILDSNRFSDRIVSDPHSLASPAQLVVAIPNGSGQAPLYLTPEDIANAGGHQVTNPHTGQRVWQFGLWQEHGEWVYPPFRNPSDIDGSRYRANLSKLREAHKEYVRRHEGRSTATVRRFDDD